MNGGLPATSSATHPAQALWSITRPASTPSLELAS